MAKYLDETGLTALWAKIKQRIQEGVGDVDLSAYLQVKNLATINGQKLSEGGDITIDLTLFTVVSELPTNYVTLDKNKIYLVKSTETGKNNIYTEYICTGSTTDSDGGIVPVWEKLGEYSSNVDLSEYAKTADVNTALASKVDVEAGKGLSTNDFTDELFNKLDSVSTDATKENIPAVMLFSGFVSDVSTEITGTVNTVTVLFDTTKKTFVGLSGAYYYIEWKGRNKYVDASGPYSNKIYVDTKTNIPYRWDGEVEETLVPISSTVEAIAVETIEALG